jgi:hypothetical protein
MSTANRSLTKRLYKAAHVGAITSAGTSARQSAASWVGLQRRFRKEIRRDVGLQAITLASCPEITSGQSGTEALARLLSAALADMLTTAQAPLKSLSTEQAPKTVCLAFPQSLSEAGAADAWHRSLELLRQYGHGAWTDFLANLPNVAFKFGNAASYRALECLQTPAIEHSAALVIAVDRLLDVEFLRSEYKEKRLLTSDASDGYIPGEAAACLWLLPCRDTHHSDDRTWVLHPPCIANSASAHCQDGIDTDPLALTQALKGALANAGWQGQHVGRTLSDFDGSAWRAKLQMTARMRASGELTSRDWEPASVTGQIGAASGAVHWALAVQRLRHDKQVPNSILAWALDAHTATGAVALERTLCAA